MFTQSFFSDVWTEIQTYYDSLVSIFPHLLIGLVVFLLFFFVSRALRKYVLKIVLPRTDDPLLTRFIARVAQATLMLVGVIVVLRIMKLQDLAGGLLAGAGVGAFAIGFALKDIGENFLAGIMLAFSRPFSIGDLVELQGIQGRVSSLTLRNIQIRTGDGKDVFIPNASLIRNPLINLTIDNDLRYDFTVGLDYGSDYNRAIEIILDTLKKEPNIMQTPKAPSVMVSKLSPSTVDLTVYYWIEAFKPGVSAATVKNEAIFHVLHELTEAGYYLPGNIMELKNYNAGPIHTKGIADPPETENRA